jgi:hypothetical protein
MLRFSLMRRAMLGLCASALLLGAAGQAHAGFVQLSSPAQLGASDITAQYTGADGDVEPSGYSITAGGETLTFTTADSGNMVRATQGTSWSPGAFPDSTGLLVSIDPNTGTGSAITITFSSPVKDVGLEVQQNSALDTTFTATVSGTAPSLMGTVMVAGSAGAGSLGFIGFAGTGGDLITSLVISSSDGMPADNNEFAMGPVTFGPNVIPEPSTLAMLPVSIVGLLAYRWMRRRRSAA